MQLAVRIAFGLVFLALVISGHVYLYRRLIRDVTTEQKAKWFRRLSLAMLAVVGAMGFSRAQSTEEVPTALLLPLWFGLALNLLLILVPVDLVRWAQRRWTQKPDALPSPERRQFLSRAVATGTVVAGAGITSFGAFRAYEPAHVSETVIRLPGLPSALSGFTLVQLTDLHIGPVLQRRFLDDLVQRANAQRPDLVAITGDLVDGSTQRLGPIVARLSGLQSQYGSYFVTGNHDYYSGADAWVRTLEGLGVQVLRNRHVRIGDAAASFDLIGVDDWGHGGGSGDYDLDQALRGRDPSRPSVLLAHQPSNFDEVAHRGIGLQLSGHTHGGQLFPSTLMAQLIWGDRTAGLSTVGSSTLYVSRGCGFVGPPMRNGSPPELVKVVLLPG